MKKSTKYKIIQCIFHPTLSTIFVSLAWGWKEAFCIMLMIFCWLSYSVLDDLINNLKINEKISEDLSENLDRLERLKKYQEMYKNNQ